MKFMLPLLLAVSAAVHNSASLLTENTTTTNQTQRNEALLTCNSCSNFQVGNETISETCLQADNLCIGTYCFALYNDKAIPIKFFSGCVNVSYNIDMTLLGGNGGVCKLEATFTECICIRNQCNAYMETLYGRAFGWTDGDILPAVNFDLAKKAVLVGATQLAGVDGQGIGSRSIETVLENSANVAAISSSTTTIMSVTIATTSTATSTTINISETATVSKHARSISCSKKWLALFAIAIAWLVKI